jgi:zinc D-Ala-D-Ala dipeptidase
MWRLLLSLSLSVLVQQGLAQPGSQILALTQPEDFVYLREVVPSIRQEIRNAGYHNLLGRPLTGYLTNECLLQRKAAVALAKVQQLLQQSRLGLKVYECYIPQTAVDEINRWLTDAKQISMKQEFYPRLAKADLLTQKLLPKKSSYARGSTVDITLIAQPLLQQEDYHPGQSLKACDLDSRQRFYDNSVDMGTGYSCMDKAAAYHANVGMIAMSYRKLLREAMQAHGFIADDAVWWRFTLKNETYPHTYFRFPIVPK